jgi:ubiquinone/menaquinone biosynthesis C-methylase UbiE
MMKREPLACGIFRDMDAARRYDKESRARTRSISRSFASVAREREITDGQVLDVGTGTGWLAIEFAKEIPGVEVIGLDLSGVALELARENAQESGVSSRVSFEIGDAEDMPFENDIFDLAISSNTLHLVKSPVRMLDEIQRVLKPKGVFLVSDLRRSWLGILSKHLRASYSPKEVKGLLGQSKLKNWELRDYFFWLSISSQR